MGSRALVIDRVDRLRQRREENRAFLDSQTETSGADRTEKRDKKREQDADKQSYYTGKIKGVVYLKNCLR